MALRSLFEPLLRKPNDLGERAQYRAAKVDSQLLTFQRIAQRFLTEEGEDFKEGFLATYEALNLFRKVRSLILISSEFEDTDTRLLECAEIAIQLGEIYLEKDPKTVKFLISTLRKRIGEATQSLPPINDPFEGSMYANFQNPYFFYDLRASLFEESTQHNEFLAEAFSRRHDPHRFLKGIRITDLEGKFVIILAAMSMGLVQGGLLVAFMRKELKIDTHLVPVFINKETWETYTPQNPNLPKRDVVLIPFDDEVVGTGDTSSSLLSEAKRNFKAAQILKSSQYPENSK